MNLKDRLDTLVYFVGDALYEEYPVLYLGGCATMLPVLANPESAIALLFFAVTILLCGLSFAMLIHGPFLDPVIKRIVREAEAEEGVAP